MSKKFTQEEAMVEVSRTLHDREAEAEETRIKIRPFITDVAKVSVKYGLTISTAKKEHADIKAGVEGE